MCWHMVEPILVNFSNTSLAIKYLLIFILGVVFAGITARQFDLNDLKKMLTLELGKQRDMTRFYSQTNTGFITLMVPQCVKTQVQNVKSHY